MKITRRTTQLWSFVEACSHYAAQTSRLEALMCTEIDPFVAALDFRGCYLQKTVFKCSLKVKDDVLSGIMQAQGFPGVKYGYSFRQKTKKVMLTNKEKQFLIRRLNKEI